MEINFCRRCGTPLEEKSTGFYQCKNLHDIFLSPAPTMGVLFLQGDSVLLSERLLDPDKGLFDAPGGFLEPGESFLDALYREVKEELGLTADDFETPQFLCSAPSMYRYQDEGRPVVGVMYTSALKPGAKIQPGDDSAGVVSFTLHQINFDVIYGEDTRYALRLLQQSYMEDKK